MFGRSKRKKQQAEETLAAQTQLEQQGAVALEKESDEDVLEKNEGVLRELSEEEREKFGDLKVDLESMISALKEIGYSDEEIAEMIPQPLKLSEQCDLWEKLKKLHKERDYATVIEEGIDYYLEDRLWGGFGQLIRWALGTSAIAIRDVKNTQGLAGDAATGYIFQMGLETPACAPAVLKIMELGEDVAPGCMHSAALILYPEFSDFFGEDHEYTKGLEKYMA